MQLSAKENTNVVDGWFYLLTKSPVLCKSNLDNNFLSIESIESIVLNFPEKLKVSTLKAHIKLQEQYVRLFPTIFIQVKVKTPYKVNIQNTLLLKTARTFYKQDEENNIWLSSQQYTNLGLLIQMSLYLLEQEYSSSQNLLKLQDSTTALYLSNKLGVLYSQGQLIDFIDRLYDQYKHTKITAHVFRKIFRYFGSYTEEIANSAFDNFMETRNTNQSWSTAIKYFLKEKLKQEEFISDKVVQLILDNQPNS